MNFEIVSANLFKINSDYFKRIFSVLQKRNGLVKITNAITGNVFLDNLNPNTILIANVPMVGINELQKITFQKDCFCENELQDESKNFDKTFDKTFE